MAYMKDRSLKQIATNIIPQGNVPTVPQQFQTGSYYPQGTTNTPPPMGDAFVAGPQGPQIYNNQMGMGAQMGTAPIAQTAADSTGTTMAGMGEGQFANPYWKQVATKSDSTFKSKGINPAGVTFPKSIQKSLMTEGSTSIHKIYGAKGELEQQYGISKEDSEKHMQKVDSTLNANGINLFD